MKADKKLKFPNVIYSKISQLSGPEFQKLVQAILEEAGFEDVIQQSSGSQGGFDIRATLYGLEWRFEAKKTKGDALAESDLAEKFDQIERNPGDTEYYIIVTNTNLSNDLRRSIVSHRNKWYIDLDYWSSCNDKFRRILLSYPNGILKELSLSKEESSSFLEESQQYLKHNKPFLEEEYETLLRTSNRFNLLQNIFNSISMRQEQKVQPKTEFSKLLPRNSANAYFEKFKASSEYSCSLLLAKEQMGKSSLLRLWANSVRRNNIVLFFTASDICSNNWLKKLQNKVYPEIEIISGGRLQYPEYLSTVFNSMRSRLKSKDAFVYVFVDALNTASYGDIKDFFGDDDFNESLNNWRFNWMFSCRESIWKEWKSNIGIPKEYLEFTLKEFNDEELELALKTHKIDLKNVPHWLIPKLKWPGLLRLCEKIQSDKPDILKNMPELALAEMSFLFIRERMEEFAGLHPGGVRMKREGVEEKVNEIVDLFNEQGYHRLPFSKIRIIKDFEPHNLDENSWNILLQQGFLTKHQENYELGNDWAVILSGKHLVETCMRNDVSESAIGNLLDKIFDGIAPLGNEQFEDILWFSLHYGKICHISESLFAMLLDRIFEGQNLSHSYLSEVAARLFPKYSIRYLVGHTNKENRDLYLREGLEKASAEEVVPEVINLFPDTSDDIRLQMAILLNHHKDIRFLEDVYSLLDQDSLSEDKHKKIHIEDKLKSILNAYPDECCELLGSRFEKGAISNLDLAISLLGWNGNSKHAELLQQLINRQLHLSATSLRAMGELRMPEVEDIAMRFLESESDTELQIAAIDALGQLQSNRFFEWCKVQTNLWDKGHYMAVIRSLQNFESSEAYDLIISLELQQEKWIPFISFYTQNRLRKLNKDQFIHMVEGILNKIQDGENLDAIWRGLHNLSTLNSKSFKSWWQEYQGTKVPKIIADMARLCAKPKYFDSRGRTLASMAMDEALKILDWINDREVLVSLLLDLMGRDIPRLFAWTLFPFIVKHSDVRFKPVLINLAKIVDVSKPNNQDIYEVVQNKAIICLTCLGGEEVADTILNYRGNLYSEEEKSLIHFYSESFVKKLIQIFKTRDETLFWGAYCFLWEFLPEEALEPSFAWLKDTNCSDWIKKYLVPLIGKYDKAEYNSYLLKHLNNPLTEVEVSLIDIFVYSKDVNVHNWFKKRIASYSMSPIAISSDIEKKEHKSLIQWIRRHQYKEAKTYIQQWIEEREITWLTAQWLIYDVYDLIAKFEFWEFLEPIKNKYYRWNPQWGSHIIEATLKLVYHREPEWAWCEFLKYWNNASDFHKKDAIKWVEFMPSKVSIEWLINNYPNIGSFFSDEKEIRQSIRMIINNFPKETRQYGIEILLERAKSGQTIKRINAAICSGLFGEEIYKQFGFFSNDQCSRVRTLYRYADTSEAELMSAV